MEELSPDVQGTFRLGSPECENPGIPDSRVIWPTRLESERASLLSEPELTLNDISNSSSHTNNNFVNPESNEIASLKLGESKGNLDMLKMPEITEYVPEGEEVENLLVGEEPRVISSLKAEPSIISSLELLPRDSTTDIRVPLNADSDTGLPIAVEIQGIKNGQIVAKVITLEESSFQRAVSDDVLTIATRSKKEYSNAPTIKKSVVSVQLSYGKDSVKGHVKCAFEWESDPLWGSSSIRGHNPEMEDALLAKPHFMKIPIDMFIENCQTDGRSQTLTHLTSHFFGVYDGHGGSQVANYCRDRIHLALIEELKKVQDDLVNGCTTDIQQAQWEKVFTSCFLKVDDEVGGKVVSRGIVKGDVNMCNRTFEPIAPGTTGSTAVVAVVCSSHIIVANCGDSRAVLYRGKEAIALSSDHKPSREDEYSRIEAAGGMVIQWNGYRVLGVLAMSRSIGDRYMKPCIIPDPEVRFVPRAREDECLVLASDGLWDVMTNVEVCEVARKQILIWHKKNGTNPIPNRGQGTDLAAQSAAEYLANLALQKGSEDNISIIVIDLKAQRKFKSKY